MKPVRCRELRITLGNLPTELRRHCHVAEVINGLAQHGAAVAFAGGDLGHGEVRLVQHHALGVNANEDVRHRLDIQIMRQFHKSDQVVPDGKQSVMDCMTCS